MVEIKVAVEDPVRLQGLLVGLAGLLDGSSLSFDERHNELCVSTEWEPCDIDDVIGVFESWLAADGMGASAKLCIGDAAYELAGSGQPTHRATTRARAQARRRPFRRRQRGSVDAAANCGPSLVGRRALRRAGLWGKQEKMAFDDRRGDIAEFAAGVL